MNREKFAQKFEEEARKVDWVGIPWRFGMAQADLESGRCADGSIASKTNNLFAITAGSSWKGKTYKTADGRVFRAYDSWADSMRDWVRLMHVTRYHGALVAALSKDLKTFAAELVKAGYTTTDTATYAASLVSRFNTYA